MSLTVPPPVSPPEDRGQTGRRRPPRTPKGRQVDPRALQEVQALLGERQRRRDLLIEYLHLVQDRYGYLSAAHLAALGGVDSRYLIAMWRTAESGRPTWKDKRPFARTERCSD